MTNNPSVAPYWDEYCNSYEKDGRPIKLSFEQFLIAKIQALEKPAESSLLAELRKKVEARKKETFDLGFATDGATVTALKWVISLIDNAELIARSKELETK